MFSGAAEPQREYIPGPNDVWRVAYATKPNNPARTKRGRKSPGLPHLLARITSKITVPTTRSPTSWFARTARKKNPDLATVNLVTDPDSSRTVKPKTNSVSPSSAWYASQATRKETK